MYGQGHYWCPNCQHAVYSRYGGCRTCRTPLAELLILDEVIDGGLDPAGIGFDPFDREIAFGIPGTPFAVEPDGQVDLDLGGFEIPL
jgi:hypothetical protein